MTDQGFPSWTVAEGVFLLHRLVFVSPVPSDRRLETIMSVDAPTLSASPSTFGVDQARLLSKIRSLTDTQQQEISEQFQSLRQADSDRFTSLAALTQSWMQDTDRDTIAPVIQGHLERLGIEVKA